MGMEWPKLHRTSSLQTALRPRRSGGSAHLAEVPFGVETSSPPKDQGICLALAKTAPDDEVPAAMHGPGCSSRMPTVRQGSGGLPTSVLCLSLGPGCVAGVGCRPPRDDPGGGILAISQQWNISSRS